MDELLHDPACKFCDVVHENGSWTGGSGRSKRTRICRRRSTFKGNAARHCHREMSKMGCYHFHLNQLSRGKDSLPLPVPIGRYKLECTYYGEVSDYTRKRRCGILRSTFKYGHQKIQKTGDTLEWGGMDRRKQESTAGTQLWHYLDEWVFYGRKILSLQEDLEEQLVARGMIADLAIHDPKKAKDKFIPYAHHGYPPFKGRWHLGTKTKRFSTDTGWTAGSESERTTGISGGTYNGLEQEKKPWKNWEVPGEDVQWTVWRKRTYRKSRCQILWGTGIDKIPMVHEGPNVQAMKHEEFPLHWEV